MFKSLGVVRGRRWTSLGDRNRAAAECCYLFMFLCRSAFDEWQQRATGTKTEAFPAAHRRTRTPALSFKRIRSDMQVRTRPPKSPQPRLRTSSYVIFFFFFGPRPLFLQLHRWAVLFYS